MYMGWVFAVVGFLLTPVLGWGGGQQTTTVITSNSMTASSEKNQAIFRENVKMVQEDLVVLSDMMIVYFEDVNASAPASAGQPPSQTSQKEILSIEAKGDVKIAKGESRARCQHALYNKQEERLVLRGSPVVWQDGTRVSGRKITMYLKENRSVVEGNTRVTIEGEEAN